MENKSAPWQERFGLTLCTASALETAIPATALGVAVIYAATEAGETVFLVLESRASSLRDRCLKRLQTAGLPPPASLSIAFQSEILADTLPATIDSACRQQVRLAGELRRELRPALR